MTTTRSLLEPRSVSEIEQKKEGNALKSFTSKSTSTNNCCMRLKSCSSYRRQLAFQKSFKMSQHLTIKPNKMSSSPRLSLRRQSFNAGASLAAATTVGDRCDHSQQQSKRPSATMFYQTINKCKQVIKIENIKTKTKLTHQPTRNKCLDKRYQTRLLALFVMYCAILAPVTVAHPSFLSNEAPEPHTLSLKRNQVRRSTAYQSSLLATTTPYLTLTTFSPTFSSAAPSTITTATNQNDYISKLNEIPTQAISISHHPLPPQYVKLASNTNSTARSSSHYSVQNLHQHKSFTGASNQTFNSKDNSSDDIISQRFNQKPLFEKVCIGTSNRLSAQVNKSDHYQNLVDRYKNCTHVIGNVEITWLEKGPGNKSLDLTFLESIREITGYLFIAYVDDERFRMPNLQIIRGREVFKTINDPKGEFAMFLMGNKFKYLELPNLREIIYGHVGFRENLNLCIMQTIDWTEILNTGFGVNYVISKPAEMPVCSCSSCNNCWSPNEGMCQQFSKTVCSPQCEKGRCYGPGPRDCCHMMCAGGCTGPKQTDCFACKNFNNDGECVPECPPMNKYNPSKFLWEPDPNGKHAYGASCVKECPDHLLRDNGACVRACPPDKRSQNGECVPCAGPCPKNCQNIDVINSKNIEQLVNCTEIEGSITILQHSFDGYKDVENNNTMGPGYEKMHPSKLQVLNTVVNITGCLTIQAWHPDFKDLSFLSKLETIGGRKTNDMFQSISIIRTSLVSLNLRSLKRVRSGQVRIEENSDLCYASASQFLMNNITKPENILIKKNGDSNKCRGKGLRCHEQCGQGGCWGPGQNECLSCSGYKLDDYCVKSCDSTKSLGIISYDAGDKTCGRCHEECKDGCNGINARSCTHCKNFMDGPYCVRECPRHKYNESNICQECSKRCIDGCTGPSDRLGLGGCNACDKFIIESITNTSIKATCLKPEEPCPMGYYQEYGAEVEGNHYMKALERKPVCKRCHQKCKSCSGYGTHKDVCECAHYMANDQCEETCPRDSYADNVSRKCERCSRECNGCHGPSEADCTNCRVYRLYYKSSEPVASARVADKHGKYNIGTPKQQSRFNCTSQCPMDRPHRVSEGNYIDPYCSEDPGQDPDNPRIVSVSSTSFFLVLIISGTTMFCVLVHRRQTEKEERHKLAMAMSLGATDAEPLNQSHMPPNLAELKSITTNELQQGLMLGNGVGGTVYQAVWCPEGTKDPRIVAMKILHDKAQQNMNKEFLDEAYIMASVNHVNLVKLLGVCITPKQLILVTPLMPFGCLRDYVQKQRREIGPKDLLEWGKQIANGMAYLEEHRMVHRDLALRNVLMQTKNRVLISDFGLAKILEINQSVYHSGGGRLPIKWLAPECIRERRFTHKSDVWAFGVTIWELLTFGGKPFEECDPKVVPMAIETGARLHQPNYVSTEVYKVMYACWFYNPEDRPDFKSLSQDFVNFARDPERYLAPIDTRSNEYDSDENVCLNEDNSVVPLSAGSDLMSQHNKLNEMVGIEMRQQHNSGVDKFRFFNGSSQPLMAEDMSSRSSQQMSSKSSNTTITDPNNNCMTNESNASNLNSLCFNSEQPTDSENYLRPSPCSNGKFTYEQVNHHSLIGMPSHQRPHSSRDPPHSAGLIGISNDAYFMTRDMRNYVNSKCTTNASSGHIPSSLV